MTENVIGKGERKAVLYGNGSEKTVFIIPESSGHGDFPGLYDEIKKHIPDGEFCVLFIPVKDWNAQLSPWDAPAVFNGEPFGHGAADTLDIITRDVIPDLEKHFARQERRYFLCGYSLAGLFALYGAQVSPLFEGASGVSPSVWFPGWLDYSSKTAPKCKSVYLSLGDREEKTRHPVLKTVGDCVRQQSAIYRAHGINTVLQWNEGNHFADVYQRLAKAAAWLYAQKTPEAGNT